LEKQDRELDSILNDTVDFITRQLQTEQCQKQSSVATPERETLQLDQTESASAEPLQLLSLPLSNALTQPLEFGALFEAPLSPPPMLPPPFQPPQIMAANAPAALGRVPDMSYGSGWNHRLGSHQWKNVAQLHIEGDLGSFQEEVFFQLLSNCMGVCGLSLTEKFLVERMEVAWQERHFRLIPSNSFGSWGPASS